MTRQQIIGFKKMTIHMIHYGELQEANITKREEAHQMSITTNFTTATLFWTHGLN